MPASYTKPTRISLKTSPEYNEKWVQDLIKNDPSILGLGDDLIVRDIERIQPGAGRLDILLEGEDNQRYEVEIQLGATDETHIIRTIEYWDIEKRRYPQYEHTAVIVAEDVTSRFLNVINLFNGAVPIVAIQMQAFAVGEHATLVFTKVVDVLERGSVDIDPEPPTTRKDWEEKAPSAINMMDQLFPVVKDLDPKLELNYNKRYVGLTRDGRVDNFVTFRPQKNSLMLRIKVPRSEEIETQMEQAGLSVPEYNTRRNYYPIRATKNDIANHRDVISQLIRSSYEYKNVGA